ncbi:MAG TPA: hypothetical protein VMJ70_04190, partial [Candidatus Sulfotelmatobacter sp.]|nr:hypothetical protein [Candidatus Sulfotelmatobacter sp.]
MSLAPATPPASSAARAPRRQHRLAAWIVAIGADALQWVLFPIFGLGALSPINSGLDLVVAIVLWRLLGWHWALLPSFVAELIPGLDLVPCWIAAVFLMTRGRPPASSAVPVEPAGPAPPTASDAPRLPQP